MVVKVSWKHNLNTTEKLQLICFTSMKDFGKWRTRNQNARIISVEKVKKAEAFGGLRI